MSAAAVLQAAVLGALNATPGLAECPWFDVPPDRAGMPHGMVEWPVLADWSTKTTQGREGRLVLSLVDGGEVPLRLCALVGAAEDAIGAMEPALTEGWRVVTCLPMRNRMTRMRDGDWIAVSEFVVRLYRENG